MNDIWSRGPTTLRDRDSVTGVVHAANVTKGSNVVVSGGIDHTPAFDPVNTLSWIVSYPAGTAADVVVNAGQTRTLAPGLYGNLVLNSQATVNMQTGVYYLSTLDMESGSKINLDQANGPVIIYEASRITLRGTFVATSGASPDLLLGYLGTNPVFVESLFNGAPQTPSLGHRTGCPLVSSNSTLCRVT